MAKKKGTSQTDLEQGIIGSAPAAERIAEVMRLFPMVLLREDPRVQAVYLAWLERMPDEAPTDQEAKLRILMSDATQLFALLRDLGLEQYRWLPQMLRFEFDRATREIVYRKPFAVEVTLPADLPWLMVGNRPKRKPGAMGGFRLEDLERNLLWFYLCEVKAPPVPKRRLAIEQGCTRSNVQSATERARTLLDCIDAPLPRLSRPRNRSTRS